MYSNADILHACVAGLYTCGSGYDTRLVKRFNDRFNVDELRRHFGDE